MNAVKARPSLGQPGRVWIEVERSATGGPLGAHLSVDDALALAGALLLAVEQMTQDDQ